MSTLAKKHLGTRSDLVAVPLQHDTPGQIAQPGGVVPDWRGTERPASRAHLEAQGLRPAFVHDVARALPSVSYDALVANGVVEPEVRAALDAASV